jgi:hypothetical protein
LQVLLQTERFASDLKKELSKIQREREVLRAWLAEARPEYHEQIYRAKELVELNMQRYRAFERDWKRRVGIFATHNVCRVFTICSMCMHFNLSPNPINKLCSLEWPRNLLPFCEPLDAVEILPL